MYVHIGKDAPNAIVRKDCAKMDALITNLFFSFKPKLANQEEKFNLYCSGITSCCKCNFSNDEALKIIKENTLKTIKFMSKKEL